MAEVPISGLPASSGITSASLVPTVSGGVTQKATADQLLGGLPDVTTGSRGIMTAAQATTLANATNSNTVSTLVKRDSSGDFAAHNITANLVTGLANPTNPTDAANKSYVDAAAVGLTVKTPARAATTGSNITLSGGAPTTLDGLTLVANDRILVKDQSDPKENGIYYVATLGTGANGTWTRTSDANTGAGLVSGSYIFVTAGTTNGGSSWVMTTPGVIVIGTSNIVWFLYNQVTSVPASAITGQIISSQIANFAITTAQFASGLTPVEIVNTLPSTGNFTGRTVFLTSDSQLYRYASGAFTKSVPTTNLSGTITSTQIADNSISTPKLQANCVAAGNIAANAVTAGTIAANAVTAGTIQAGAISTTELAVGGVTGTKIASGTIATANIASGAIVANLINVSNLAAINANLGTVTAGSLTASASVSVGSGTGAVSISSSGLQIAGGTINMAGDGANPYVRVYGTGGYAGTYTEMRAPGGGSVPAFFQAVNGSSNVLVTGTSINLNNANLSFNGSGHIQKGSSDSWTPPLFDGVHDLEFQWNGSDLKVRIDGSTVKTITTT
jgi:hypothetical protein